MTAVARRTPRSQVHLIGPLRSNPKSESQLQNLPQRGAKDARGLETWHFLVLSAPFRGYSRLLQLPPEARNPKQIPIPK
jgi:hypothetical protein